MTSRRAVCAGRVYLATSRPADAVDCLTEGLALATLHQQREDEAKIRHRLGLAQAARGHLAAARDTLSRAAELFEEMRRQTAAAAAEGHGGGDARLTLFDLQTACYQALQVGGGAGEGRGGAGLGRRAWPGRDGWAGLAIPYRTVPYRTVPYRTVPYRTVPYRTVPYRTVLYGEIYS